MNKKAVFVGKFIAFHRGHSHYIRHFSSRFDELNLVLCTLKTDRVPADIREYWLKKELKSLLESKKVKLHVMPQDNIPEYPEGMTIWCSQLKDLVGRVDTVCGNDEYVRESAEIMKTDCYMPDTNRSNFHCSSTYILNSGLSSWHLVNESNRGYFSKIVQVESCKHECMSGQEYLENVFDENKLEFGKKKSDLIKTPILYVKCKEERLPGVDEFVEGEWTKEKEEKLRRLFYTEIEGIKRF